MTCQLIVNRNGRLSACPDMDTFTLGNFITDPNVVRVQTVDVSLDNHALLWANRDNAYIVGDGVSLPDGGVPFVVTNGVLEPCVGPLCK